jgi:hypothetical protein
MLMPLAWRVGAEATPDQVAYQGYTCISSELRYVSSVVEFRLNLTTLVLFSKPKAGF